MYARSGARELHFFTKTSTWLGGRALAGSALLKQRNEEISATGAVMGVLLKNKTVEV